METETKDYRLHGYLIQCCADGTMVWATNCGPEIGLLIGKCWIDRDVLYLSSWKYRDTEDEELNEFLAGALPWTMTAYFAKGADIGGPSLRRCDTGEAVAEQERDRIMQRLFHRDN